MRLQAFFLVFALLCGNAAQAREFRIALSAQDSTMVTAPTDTRKDGRQSGGLLGFNEALAREICRRVTTRCTMSYLSFAEILPGIEAGQYDLGFGNFLRTPERENRANFSEPIWRSSSRLVAKPALVARLTEKAGGRLNLDTLQGVTVAVVDGSVQHRHLREAPAERAIGILPLKTMADVIGALRDDKTDLIFIPMLSTYALINREPVGSFEFVGPPVADRGLGGSVHIAIGKQQNDVLQQVNQAIAAMRADGTYQRIVRQYFPFSLD